MISEYESGSDVFDLPNEEASAPSEEQKSTKKVVRRRKYDGKPQIPVKEEKEEALPPQQDAVAPDEAAEKAIVKRRGRPSRKTQITVQVEQKEEEGSEVKEEEISSSADPVEKLTQQMPVSQHAHMPQQPKPYVADGRQSSRQKQNHGKNNHQSNRSPNRLRVPIEDTPVEYYIEDANAPKIIMNDLTLLTLPALRQKATEFNIPYDTIMDLKRQELIVEILKTHAAAAGVIMAYGSLEILPDGYGFLRLPQNNYLSGPDDIYMSVSQIKMLNLKTGDTVEGQIRPPRDAERYFAMVRVQSINYDPPDVAKTRAGFDTLTPLYPNQRLNLETADGDVSTRLINLFCPIGKGQRSLIVAPPRAGKTILMQKIANAITENHPEVYLIVLLIDERPEEVTDMRRTVKGEVIASTFDEQATHHVSVAEMVIEKAKRLVEHKHDVVILLDNITRLARAYNQTVPASGKILSGGVDSNALHKPKRFLGAARNIEHGGSLTIIASALIETGSRMDEVIFEEFKGTGNNEIVLDRRMSERRLFPAINIKKSGTRREDLLLTAEEAAKIWALRNAINPMDDIEMTELLIDKMRKTKNNEAFLRSMNTGVA